MKDDLVDAHLLNHHTLAPAVRPAPKVRVIVGVGQDDIDLDPQAPLRPSEFEVGARASPLHLEIDVAPHPVAGLDLVRGISTRTGS